MRLKMIAIMLAAALSLNACSVSVKQGNEAENAGADAAEETEEEESSVGMINPWEEITEEDAKTAIPRMFNVPEGATNTYWQAMEPQDPDSLPGTMVELDFDLNGASFNARAQYGSDEGEDISGMYYEWDQSEDVTLANWGGGEMRAKVSRCTSAEEPAILCSWYDVEIGIGYCLSSASEHADEIDIVAIADSMAPDEEFMPGSFAEEKAQKNAFDSEEDLLSYLEKGQGYAKLKLIGRDEEVLGISSVVREENGKMVGDEFCVYVERDGKLVNAGNAYSVMNGRPLQYADGVIVAVSDDEYDSYFLNPDGDGVMMKDYICHSKEDDDYYGFLRKDNSFDSDEELPENAGELLEEYLKEAESYPFIEFTVVE